MWQKARAVNAQTVESLRRVTHLSGCILVLLAMANLVAGGLHSLGDPSTLVLTRLQPINTKPRAPGPGPIRKRDWEPIANRHLKGKRVVLHTDGARAYKMKVEGVLHDNVVHAKKRVVVNGKTVWLRPKFTKTVTHTLPDKKKLTVKAGTQIIDRIWRHVRAHLEGNSAKTGSTSLSNRIRSAQWTYWNRGADLWEATGEMIQAIHP